MNARTRLVVSVALGLAASVPAFILIPWQIADLVGWDVATTFFAGSVFLATRGRSAEQTRAMATREDDSRVAADAILIGASLASLVGVGLALLEAGNQQGSAHTFTVAVAFLSVVLAWTSIQTIFTLRYARLFYDAAAGIDWHDHEPPDFGDFAYVALTIGMTFQVSDTEINTKPIRKTALRHAVLSYLFGVVILATTINVVASLLTK